MLKGKVKKFFLIENGNSGLTEEFIYSNQAMNPDNKAIVYSSATTKGTSMKNVDKNCKIFRNSREYDLKYYTNEGIIIARNGKAGTMQYVNDDFITMTDHAYLIKVKDKYKDLINIRYVEFLLKPIISECITSDKTGNQTFGKTLFNEKFIKLPEKEEQDKLVNEFIRLEELFLKLSKVESSLTKILSKTPHTTHGNWETIDIVFNLMSENRSLTEEYIYRHQGEFPVYSAQTNGAYGYINKPFCEGELLNVVQYGDAGRVFHREGKFSIGRNTCGLIPRDTFKDKINLKYMAYALEEAFVLNSKGDGLKSLSQGTIKNTKIFLPDIKEQNEIAEEYIKLEKIKYQTQQIIVKLEKVLF